MAGQTSLCEIEKFSTIYYHWQRVGGSVVLFRPDDGLRLPTPSSPTTTTTTTVMTTVCKFIQWSENGLKMCRPARLKGFRLPARTESAESNGGLMSLFFDTVDKHNLFCADQAIDL